VGAAMTAEARKTVRASLRGIVGGAMMAAALVLGMTACSSENDLAEETKTIETQATVIHVTVGAGISDGEATTRSTVDYTGGTRTLQFTTGDKLYVWGKASHSIYASGAEYYGYVLAGMLALDAIDPDDPTKATFSGDLSVYEALVDGDYNDETGDWNVIYRVTYPDANRLDYLPYFISSDDPLSSCDYVRATLIHEGTESQVTIDDYKDISLPTYDCAATVDELMTTGLIVTGNYYAGTKSFTLGREDAQPIVNCTIAGLEGSTDYQFVLKKGAAVATSVGWTTDAGGTASFAFISRESGSAEWTLDVTKGGSTVGTISLGSGEMALASKVYNVSRYWDGTAMHPLVDLSKKTGDYYTAKDGEALTGTMPTGKYVRIASEATVTLCGVTIEGKTYGILCTTGNTTIILADGTTNTVKGGSYYPGIQPPQPSGRTLTIQGNGTLIAEGGSTGGPGIGGSFNNSSAGDITILGGNITATGGANAAGIGAGAATTPYTSYCGVITISGGTVTAMGGANAAGIGSGKGSDSSHRSACGTVTITSDVTSVTATKGDGASYSIGKGYGQYSSCGMVTIDGVAGATTSSTFPNLTSAVDGNTWTLTKK
jgi:hypothetical protein